MAEEIKPGVKTSEFWLVIFGLIASVFPTVLALLGDHPWVAAFTAATVAVLGVAYIGGRTLLKMEAERQTNVIPDAWEPAMGKALDIIDALARTLKPGPAPTQAPPGEEAPKP